MGKKNYRNKGSKDNIIISIAGVHGVGKTTIFNLLKKELEKNGKFKFFPERYKKIPPFPFGSVDKQIAFRSEMHFLQQFVRRNQNIVNYDNKYNGRILIMDRTPLCVLIYSKSLHLKEKDYNLILDMYNSVGWKEDYIIYLTAEPDTILRRVIQRGSIEKVRKEWNEDEKNYLLTVLSYYNQMLINKIDKETLFIINTESLTPEEVIDEIKTKITSVSGFRFKQPDEQPSTQKNLDAFF